MELLFEMIGQLIIEVIFEGSIAVVRSKKTSWIAKGICLLLWGAFFALLFFSSISIIRGSYPVLGYMLLGFTIFLAIGFSYGVLKGEE